MQRPDHHDFTRLSAVVIEADDRADRGEDFEQTMAGLIDVESMVYMADGRVKLMARHAGITVLSPAIRTAMLALWADALRAGIRFQQEGGHS